MSDVLNGERTAFGPALGGPEAPNPLPLAAQYLASAALVAVATLAAFLVDHLVAAPNLTLVFVLPVVIAATTFGWGPSLAAVALSVLSFDFFFTQPFNSFAIANASDLWAAALLLVTAAIVSALAAEARRRAVDARRAAAQARALQDLAHVVIQARPQPEVNQAAAKALHEIFAAPAVIFAATKGGVEPAATAGDADITSVDRDAAAGALSAHVHVRGEAYPYDQTEYDFWPLTAPSGGDYVLGVNFKRARLDRPQAPERFIEIVGAYVATALGGAPSASPR